MSSSLREVAETLVSVAGSAVAAAGDEANLRHEIEKALEIACKELGFPWVPFQLERRLRRASGDRRRADVAHGAVVIEYEPPGSFSEGHAQAKINHAKNQAEEYCALLAADEGRPQEGYVLVVWDGAHMAFGRYTASSYTWDAIEPFNVSTAERLLKLLRDNGAPLVHPALLTALAGPSSPLGEDLLPKLFAAVRAAAAPDGGTTKTRLLFFEWRRLFGQAAGVQSAAMRRLLRELGAAHGAPYEQDGTAYLFALNTYIALVAKITAAMALPGAAQDIRDSNVAIGDRITALESGRLFADAGIANMLNGDFFSWYRDDGRWPSYSDSIAQIIESFRGIVFDVTRKSPASTRDLFKGLYMSFVPRALRHSLGEFYTPDWLAAHALDTARWKPEESLLDPTCGSGTFILEGLKRRLEDSQPHACAADLLDGLYGIDLNPIAVLSARASLVVYLAGRLDPARPVRLPVYLADTINPATAVGGVYEHVLRTEEGVITFILPADLVEHADFFDVFARARELIDANFDGSAILHTISNEFDLAYLSEPDSQLIRDCFDSLVQLHRKKWNGSWVSILADRFAAGAIPPVRLVVGNPPWVKWSHLPPEYVKIIKSPCSQLGVFSEDVWVGGIESDISTVITYKAFDKYCRKGGRLVFLITGTVFVNESSQGFRRWWFKETGENMRIDLVEDFAAVKPFEGVSNHATLLVVHRDGRPTTYPITYRVWLPPRDDDGRPVRVFETAAAFRHDSTSTDLLACPVPGSDAGPWLRGTAARHEVWRHVFGRQEHPAYAARKGVTTDANGIFFVTAKPANGGLVRITNEPSLGRRADVPRITKLVEPDHLFPLLRGEGVTAFRAGPDSAYRVLVPQRGMHGDPDLPTSARRTHAFLAEFQTILARRSSYRRFQPKQPYWSLWSTGPYTFSAYKVLWREMGGGGFAAAYVGSYSDPVLNEKLVIPDHKLYFVPCGTEDEAAYLTGVLNAPVVAEAVASYAAQLSLGVSVVEYLLIPKFDPDNADHTTVSLLAQKITHGGGMVSPEQWEELNYKVGALFGIPTATIDAATTQDAITIAAQRSTAEAG